LELHFLHVEKNYDRRKNHNAVYKH